MKMTNILASMSFYFHLYNPNSRLNFLSFIIATAFYKSALSAVIPKLPLSKFKIQQLQKLSKVN